MEKKHKISANILRLIAPNPSPMTFHGTNTYLLGHDELMIIDPGPLSNAHLGALLDEIGSRKVSHILVTHSHLDHSPLAKELQTHVDAPICAYGKSDAGLSEVMKNLAKTNEVRGGEGVDHDFEPDLILSDNHVVQNSENRVTCIHTPGHMANHMCFSTGEVLFSGDHIMGWASTMVSPPDGDISDFMASSEKLIGRDEKTFLPGHGDKIDAPLQRIQELIDHRKHRESQIINALGSGPASISELTQKIYHDTPKSLHGAAQRNVLAHLIDLTFRGLTTSNNGFSNIAEFKLK